MFVDTPELAPDLDWMLQSGQASSEMLADALVEEYYGSIYRIALSILDDSQRATRAAFETFVTALLNSYRYKSSSGVKLWLSQICLAICQRLLRKLTLERRIKASLPWAGEPSVYGETEPVTREEAELWLAVDALPTRQRIPLLLQGALDCAVSEIALVLNCAENDASANLKIARRKVIEGLKQCSPEDRVMPAGYPEEWWRDSLRARWPAMVLSQAELTQLKAGIIRQVEKRKNHRKRLVYAKEVILTGMAIFLVAGIFWGANIFIPEPKPTRMPAATSLVTRLVVVRPTAKVATATPIPTATVPRVLSGDLVTYVVQPGDTLASIAEKTGVKVDELWRANHLRDGEVLQPGRNLIITAGFIPEIPSSPTPVTPVPQPPPLTAQSSSQEVQQRISRSPDLWHTLWANLEIIQYGPPGYIGPPQGYLAQVWLSQPRQSLYLLGGLDGEASYINLVNGLDSYTFDRKLGQPVHWEAAGPARLSPVVLEMLFPNRSQWFSMDGIYNVVGSSSWMGRPVVQVDRINAKGSKEASFWLDAYTGVVLHEQQFGGPEGQTVVTEFLITAIAYDVDFPARLFDVRNIASLNFSRNFLGSSLSPPDMLDGPIFLPLRSRQPLSFVPPPAGFDPSHSLLTFQFTEDFNSATPQSNRGDAFAQLFADQYYLGSVFFTNPWTTVCDRSPDGMKIVFASLPDIQGRTGPLRWFDLGDLSTLKNPFPAVSVTQFAFAPDSRHLAYFGRIGVSGAVSILDTSSGETRRLVKLADAKSFVWSPDGKFLAFIGRESSPLEDEVMVVNVATGEVTYRDPIDIASGNRSQDWPMISWGVEFPVEMGGLEACTAPPENSDQR